MKQKDGTKNTNPKYAKTHPYSALPCAPVCLGRDKPCNDIRENCTFPCTLQVLGISKYLQEVYNTEPTYCEFIFFLFLEKTFFFL